MVTKLFRGKFDMSAMGMADLAALTGALAVVEGMAARGLVEFEMHGTRPTRSDAGVSRGADPAVLQPQRAAVLAALHPNAWTTPGELAEATGIPGNSVGVHLRALADAGLAEKGTRPVEDWTGGRKTRVVFRRPEAPAAARD